MRAGTLFTTAFPIRRAGFTWGILDRSIFHSKPTLSQFQSRASARSWSGRFSSAHWFLQGLGARVKDYQP